MCVRTAAIRNNGLDARATIRRARDLGPDHEHLRGEKCYPLITCGAYHVAVSDTENHMSPARKVELVRDSPPVHWVGDGFPVSTVFSPQTLKARLSPYLLFDYSGPTRFDPSEVPRGVDSHPHRGLATVTIVYQGELEHRDSAGNSGRIRPGDVQWMTAAGGVLHEERHSSGFVRRGGTLEMAQLWVNLPARYKTGPPEYQTLRRDVIPRAMLPHAAGELRVIAGSFENTRGAATPFTPVIMWDLHLTAGAEARLPVADGFTVAVFVRSGSVRVSETHSAGARQLAIFDPAGGDVLLEAESEAAVLIIGGEPIEEPVVAYGPFVMNTREEIRAAMEDYRTGRFGRLR